MITYDQRITARAAALAACDGPQALQSLMGTSYPDTGRVYAGATGLAQSLIGDLLRIIADLEQPLITADSPAVLDADAERLAREERWT